MTNSEIFRKRFPDFKGVVDYYTDENNQLNFIDVQENQVEYSYSYVEECGCCHGFDNDTGTLEYILDDLTPEDFEELCKEIENNL